MERKQCVSDDLNNSPHSNQGFLIDRFAKKANNLNIPDTILENCSAELNEDNLKMEVPKVVVENFSSEDKENVNTNLQVKCNESINSSPNISIDNSYIRWCEKKLLENSNSDDKNVESDKNVVNVQFLDVQRKLMYDQNDTVSTPPSLLRKEISLLRNEMTEAHEFHDFEIQILKEEKLNEADSYNYVELFEKYSALMELYTTLKAEYDDYRKEQEKIKQEYQSKTADCLEFLCSQIEASDNSLNFSSASFVSFNGGIKSSTMVEEASEVEATVVHDATVLASDPLSITTDMIFKTPMQTPLKSAKKLQEEMNSTISKPIVKEVKDILKQRESVVPLNSEYNIQVLNLESALCDKVKEVEELEQRLCKLEDSSSYLKNEIERITSVYERENNDLKESLAKKTEQLSELTQKLFTEIVSLNPSLRDSLSDYSGLKLLTVFIEKIMENCKKIQDEEIRKHNAEKADWEAKIKSELMSINDLQKQTLHTDLENSKKICEGLEIQLRDAENIILNRDEQIRVLQSQVSTLKESQDFASLRETLSELESRLTLTEAEKKAAENRYHELETVVENLRHEVEANEKLRLQLQDQLVTVEEKKSEIESDNIRLKELYDTFKGQNIEFENIIKSNQSEVMLFKENLASADEKILLLKSQLQSVEAEKTDLENRCSELQQNNQHLLVEINSTKNLENIANEKIVNENDNLKQKILEKEKIMAELKIELELAKEKQMNSFRIVEELTKEIEDLKNDNSLFSKTLDTVEDGQKNLADLLSDMKNDDLPSGRLQELIENLSKIQELTEALGTKTVSGFIETVMKICKEVLNHLIKYYDNKNVEWETQRDADLNLISNLQDQIKCLTEKCTENEAKISDIKTEKEDLTELFENLKTQMDKKEEIIVSCNEEIKTLKSQEVVLRQRNDDLAAANDKTVAELKSQMLSIMTEKAEVENQCRKLEESVLRFQNEIGVKETIAKELGELEIIRERTQNENSDLKEQILKLEEMIVLLKKNLEEAKEEQNNTEIRMQNLQNENDLLKTEQESLISLTKELENLEKNYKNLMDILSDIQCQLNMPENTITELLSNDFDNKKIFSERINNIIKTQMENQIQWQETKQVEYDELQNKCEISEKKLADAENMISTLEKEIQTLQCDMRQNQEDFTATKKYLSDLQSQLTLRESEKLEMEIRCNDLEKVTESLKLEIDSSEKLRVDLQANLSSVKEEKSQFENENIRLKELCDALQVKTTKAEDVISKLDEEIGILKSEESTRLELEDLRKMFETLRMKFLVTQNMNVNRSEEIEIIQTEILKMIQTKEDLTEAKEVLSEKFNFTETEKAKAENRCCELENVIENLKQEIEIKEKFLTELKTQESEIKNENIKLKELSDTLKVQMSETENIISTKDEEIRLLKSYESEVMTYKEKLESAEETISQLKFQLESIETEKSEVENQCSELGNIVENLKQEIEIKEKFLTELKTQESEIKNENIKLKELCDTLKLQMSETENVIFTKDEEIRLLKSYESELMTYKEKLESAEETISQLKFQLESIETEKSEVENQCSELGNIVENLKQEIEIKEKFLTELKTQESEIKNENIKLKELCDTLKLQMSETENVIFTKDEEIRLLKSYESELMTYKEKLESAEETISQLKFQLESIETEKSGVESKCSELEEINQKLRVEIAEAKNLENNPVYINIQTENDDLKRRIFDSDKIITELKNELELARKNQTDSIRRVEELLREIEELKQENVGFSHALTTIEETKKNLSEVLSDLDCDGFTSDKIMKLITQKTKMSIPETKQGKIVTDFVEAITKTCKEVQNGLTKKFDKKILEWESQKDVDIQNFQDQIKSLTERNEECEAAIKQTKDSLAMADDTILQLKSQLSLIQTEKTELEIDRQKLQEGTSILKAEIDTKETIIKELDELKIVWKKIEIENGDLKQQTLESEEIIVHLKKSLEVKKEEQSRNEMKIQDLQNEIDSLKKEQEDVMTLSGKLEDIEKSNKNLLNVLREIQSHLDMPEDTLTKLMSGDLENKKIFNEKINSFAKAQMEDLKTENKHLKFGMDNLKEKVKQLTKLICESANNDLKEAHSSLNTSQQHSMSLRSKSKNMDIFLRRLDKLEEINHNLTEMLTRVLTITEFPDLEKLKLCSVRDCSNVMKKLVAHFEDMKSKMKELKEENAQLDEECETYANIIKDLKKEAAAVWKSNKEKAEAMESNINRLNEEKKCLENEKLDLLAKISKFEDEIQKLKSATKTEEPFYNCNCGNESKKINELKRAILVKEQKLLELQDLEAQASSYKSQIEYLKTALEKEKKKVGEEKEKNKKLQNELNETTKSQKSENKKTEESKILDELRMRGSISGGVVQEYVDKEKMRKLSKDIGILKELCRARYAEIKRLEAVNAALRNGTPKNSNQMDSPLRSRAYNTRSKNQIRDSWRPEINGKENDAL